jgi:hypothetical protein
VSEEFDAAQSRFLDYIDLDVNPDRIAKGLPPIDADTAREAYRLIAQFMGKWTADHSSGGAS